MQAEKLIQSKLKEGLNSHAYLLVGDSKTLDGQLNKIIEYLKIKTTDILEISPQDKKNGEITISLMRELKKDLSRSAIGQRLVIIKDADKLNPEAANSFLKTLEEPPKNTIIILLSETTELLATITSRCQVYQFPNTKINFQLLSKNDIEKIVQMTIRERFDLADKAAKGGLAPQYIDDLTLYFHQKFLTNSAATDILNRLVEAKKRLSANVSSRIILENIFLNLY